jgi:hypothetical protein
MLTELESDFAEEMESVTWTPAGGAPVSVPVIIDRGYPNQEDHIRGGDDFAMAVLQIHTNRCTSGGRDFWDFDGHTWRTAPEGAQRAGSFWTITVRREV